MKFVSFKIFSLILMALLLAVLSSGTMAQIYKTVDENGNVTYTDKPLKDGSVPVKLRPISIIEAPEYQVPVRVAEGEDGKEMSLRYLRKHYQDLAIVAPQAEESIWHPEKPVTVAWNTRYQLQPGMQVTVYLDGQAQGTSTEQIVALKMLDRGEHTAQAQLTDSRGRKIATSEMVTFYVRRPGVIQRRLGVSPSGGG